MDQEVVAPVVEAVVPAAFVPAAVAEEAQAVRVVDVKSQEDAATTDAPLEVSEVVVSGSEEVTTIQPPGTYQFFHPSFN